MDGSALKVWVTRARPGADRTAERLRGAGHDPLVGPLLEVRPVTGPAPDLRGVGALAFTSANGVRAFAASAPKERSLPVFTVGTATAEAARAAGFSRVSSANGDVEDLAAAIVAARPQGPVLHAGARHPAGDLVGALRSAGVSATPAVVYETVTLPIKPNVIIAWGELDAVLIHSPRAAYGLFAGLGGRSTDRLMAACISPAAAEPLLDVLSIRIAARPDEAALLALLGKPARAG